MACFDSETATGYLRGDLEPDESAQVAAHLEDCPACQALLREVAELIDSVRRDLTVAYAQPPAVDHQRIEQLLRLAPPQRWGFSSLAGGWHAQLLSTVALALIGGLTWWSVSRIGEHTTLSAQELLTASAAAEAGALPERGMVAHHTYSIESRRLPGKELAAAQRIEVWVDATASVKARRLFDEHHRLVAGEWTQPDGSRLVYERGRAPKHERRLDRKPLAATSVWRWELSSKDFSFLAASQTKQISARQVDAGFALAFDSASGSVAAAELTLDSKYLPSSQRVVLQEADGTLLEFRTVSQSRDAVPQSRAAGVFQPEAELLPPPQSTVARRPATPDSTLDIDRLELTASHGLQFMRSEQWNLDGVPCFVRGAWRAHRDDFLVDVVLRSEGCREYFRRPLDKLAAEPGLTLHVSVDDPSTGVVPRSPDAESSAEAAPAEAPPFSPALVQLLGRQDLAAGGARLAKPDDSLERRAQDFVRQWRQQYDEVVAANHELQRASFRWPVHTLQKREPRQQELWRSMASGIAWPMASKLGDIAVQLSRALDPAFWPTGFSEPCTALVQRMPDLSAFLDAPPIVTLPSMQLAIGELGIRVAAHEAELQAFLASPDRRGEVTAELQRLLGDLRRMEGLAQLITWCPYKEVEAR